MWSECRLRRTQPLVAGFLSPGPTIAGGERVIPCRRAKAKSMMTDREVALRLCVEARGKSEVQLRAPGDLRRRWLRAKGRAVRDFSNDGRFPGFPGAAHFLSREDAPAAHAVAFVEIFADNLKGQVRLSKLEDVTRGPADTI